MKITKKQVIRISALAVLLSAAAWIAWGNTALTVRELTVASPTLPENFSGFRIAQIADLHNAEFGDGNRRLLALLAEADADIIVITGDFIDSRRTDIGTALDFAKQAAALAPVYYVTGNHEARIAAYAQLETGLTAAGVTVLRGQTAELTRNGQSIRLVGMDDPAFGPSDPPAGAADFTVLLAHRPERFAQYAASGFDLVFSGHAHGGQVRLPFVGGLIAPGQGLFPAYDSGLYAMDGTQMVVSRGLGNSLFPFRVNNRPELVLATLTRQEV